MVIPLGINATANTSINFTIAVQNIPTNISIYLEDKIENTFTKLNDNGNYQVLLSEIQSGVGHFYLHTRSKVLSTEDASPELEQIRIWLAKNKTLKIANVPSEKATL